MCADGYSSRSARRVGVAITASPTQLGWTTRSLRGSDIRLPSITPPTGPGYRGGVRGPIQVPPGTPAVATRFRKHSGLLQSPEARALRLRNRVATATVRGLPGEALAPWLVRRVRHRLGGGFPRRRQQETRHPLRPADLVHRDARLVRRGI